VLVMVYFILLAVYFFAPSPSGCWGLDSAFSNPIIGSSAHQGVIRCLRDSAGLALVWKHRLLKVLLLPRSPSGVPTGLQW